MPPKKAKGKGKKGGKPKKRGSEASPEVGKYFYESRITELNHILSDLRTQHIEVQDRNEALQTEQENLIQDEKDIVSYLNRTIQDRTDDINNLQNDCERVEAERVKEEQDFEDEKERMKENYQRVEENLLSDLKLTVGKMHALEEFRVSRDELMQKYEDLENDEEEQKVRHKREIYEVERKFIIGEDKLKKEMDAKLKWLIEKFQAVTDMRVAATTLRVLKENIALNNMIEVKLQTLRKLYEVHDSLQSHDYRLQLMSQMSMFEAKAVSSQSRGLRSEILVLINEYYEMQKTIRNAKQMEPTILVYQQKVDALNDQIAEFATRQLILEQNLHELRCKREDICSRIRHELERNEELKDMLKEVESMLQSPGVNDDVFSIYDVPPEEEADTHSKSTILYKIYDFLKQVRDWNRYPKPVELLESRSDIYMQGKMGLVPREVILKSMIPTMDEKAEQVDGSFDLLLSEESWEFLEEEIEMETEALGAEESVLVVFEQETQTEDDITSSSSIN